MIVNWEAIRVVMRRAKRGNLPSPGDQRMLEKAAKAHPDTYKAVHKEVSDEAAREINPLHDGGNSQ